MAHFVNDGKGEKKISLTPDDQIAVRKIALESATRMFANGGSAYSALTILKRAQLFETYIRDGKVEG